MKAVLAGLLLAIGVAACAAFDGDPPDRTCRGDDDCFRAQGERCVIETKRCTCMEPVLGCVQEDAGVAPSNFDEPSVPSEVSQ